MPDAISYFMNVSRAHFARAQTKQQLLPSPAVVSCRRSLIKTIDIHVSLLFIETHATLFSILSTLFLYDRKNFIMNKGNVLWICEYIMKEEK